MTLLKLQKQSQILVKYLSHLEMLFNFLTCLCTVIKAERVSSDSVDKDYVFPDEDDNLAAYSGGNAQLMVPVDLLQNISKNISFLQ